MMVFEVLDLCAKHAVHGLNRAKVNDYGCEKQIFDAVPAFFYYFCGKLIRWNHEKIVYYVAFRFRCVHFDARRTKRSAKD